MANGDQWQGDASEGGGAQSPPGGDGGGDDLPAPRGGGRGGPPSDLILDGWGSGYEVTLDEVIDRLELVWKRLRHSPVLTAWLGLAAVLLVFLLAGAFLEVLAELIPAASTVLGAMATIIEMLQYPVSYLVGAAQFALFLPLHREIFVGEGAGGDLRGVFDQVKDIYWYVLAAVILVSLATSFGLACCIVPGLFAGFVLCQVPYLTATRRVDPIVASRRSLEVNKAYWPVILGLFVALLAVGLVSGCLFGAVGAVGGLASGKSASYVAPLLVVFGWLGMQLVALASFVVQSAVFSLIESKEADKKPA